MSESSHSICSTARRNQIFLHYTDLIEQPCCSRDEVKGAKDPVKSVGLWFFNPEFVSEQCFSFHLFQWSSTSSLMTVGKGPSGMWSCGHPCSWAKVSSFASTAKSGMPASTALWKMWVTGLSCGITDHASDFSFLAVETGQKLNGTSLSGSILYRFIRSYLV